MPSEDGFRHEAVLFAGSASLVAAAAPSIRAAVDRDEPVMAMFDVATIDLLRSALGRHAARVEFADMRTVGHNPACVIPAWRAFVDDHAHAGRTVHGFGEPVWAGRAPPVLGECRLHEALVNVAFGADESFRLACAYDTAALAPAVIDSAQGTHPFVRRHGVVRPSVADRLLDGAGLFEEALPDAPGGAVEVAFDGRSIAAVRRLVGREAAVASLDPVAQRDLVLAADELAVNSVRHGGGSGTLRIWFEDVDVVCEIADRGHITDVLVGCRRPGPTARDGRGLWMVNQLCDLVQIRSSEAGTAVRVRMAPR
jgi:anti-sigma regulatory factor (Ser/Thr protein kinase)